ncbi:MAG TPA: cupin domain-containing protein, partial [bacterium]
MRALNGLPFNLAGWIGTEMAGDQGSVGNKEVFRQSDFIFQIIKGPNRRNDFHIDPYDEIFYQLEGTAFVVYRDATDKEQVATLHPGDVLLIAAHTPHSPRRPPNSTGLVVERPRTADELDGLLWYCEQCGHKLEEQWLPCQD